MLASHDGLSPVLYYEFEGGGGISVIQGDDSNLTLSQVGFGEEFVVAILLGGKVYVGDQSHWELSGPYSISEAQALAGEDWPEMKQVRR